MDYIDEIKKIFEEMQNWLLALVGGITVLMIAVYGIRYLVGDVTDKIESMSNIKKTIIMGVGIFFLIWFGEYIIDRFANV
ncbi:MAG: hypothetical protein ABF289_13240 [Clostridiales bacterium]